MIKSSNSEWKTTKAKSIEKANRIRILTCRRAVTALPLETLATIIAAVTSKLTQLVPCIGLFEFHDEQWKFSRGRSNDGVATLSNDANTSKHY